MDIYFDKIFLDSLPERTYITIDQKLQRIYQYSFLQFKRSASCRKIKAVRDFFKFRFNDGDRIVFKYFCNGIRLIQYATHDKQIKVAEKYNKIRDVLTDGIIKWRYNAISMLFAQCSENKEILEEHSEEPLVANNEHFTEEPVKEVITNETESVIEEESYIEDEIDEDIESSILELIRKGILNDNLPDDISERLLENNDVDRAVFFEDVVNLSKRRTFFENNYKELSCLEIVRDKDGKISEDDICHAIDLFYEKTDLCIYPLFTVEIQFTGIYNMLYVPTENRRNLDRTKKNIAALLMKRIGSIEKWGNMVISFLAIKKENYINSSSDDDIDIEKRSEYDVTPSCDTVTQCNIPSSPFVCEDPYATVNEINTFNFAKRHIEDDEKTLSRNLEFIFGSSEK